ADAVAREHDDARLLALLAAVRVVVDDAVDEPVRADRDLAHAGPRPDFHSRAQRERPVGDVGARLRTLRAAREARARVDARAATLVVLADDRRVRRPPVPAELVEATRQRLAELAERQGRQRRALRRILRIGRIAGQTR